MSMVNVTVAPRGRIFVSKQIFMFAQTINSNSHVAVTCYNAVFLLCKIFYALYNNENVI